MNFDLTDDQLMFRDTVERFCGPFDLEARKRARALPGGFDRERWGELAELGLLALPANEVQGGIGGSLADCAVVAEALGRGVAAEPWLELAFLPLRLADADIGRSIAGGDTLVAVAFAELHRRYRLEPVATRAAGGKLTGEKRLVLGGGAADQFLVTASSDAGLTLFVVEASDADRRVYMIVDGSQAAELRFRDTPAQALGPLAIERAVTDTRIVAAAEMLGLAHRLFDETLAYVKQREQFGQPLGRFQVIQHRLVDCYAALEQMRSTLWRAILDTRPDDRTQRIAGAKSFIAERALKIGHEAIQMHGGMGVTDELIIGHAHKRVLLLSKLFGDPAADLSAFAEAA
jgi:hypothetical protein